MPTPILVPAHQVALVSTEDKVDDDQCPICCESLSFTFRLPGEKPHIVPECGHALHEVSDSLLELCVNAVALLNTFRNVSLRSMVMSRQKDQAGILEFAGSVDSK